MAKEKKTGTRFAVKAFSKDYLKNQNHGEESLKNEITILRILDHPNTIAFHELHETQNSIYVVMELMEGGQIFKLSQGKLTRKKTKFVLKSVLQALSYLDDKGIIHRDLKPDNIIFKYPETDDYSTNLVKLVDFGLSTFWDLDSYLFLRCGTPGFVAPEVINADKHDKTLKFSPKCDVFSVGIIYYFMLTGIIPYDGDDFKDVLKNNKKAVIDFNIKELESVDEIQMDLLKKMLELEVGRRLSAKECLKHRYFEEEKTVSSEDLEKEGEICEGVDHSQNIRDFQKKYRISPKMAREIDSLKFNARPDLKENSSDTYKWSSKNSNKIESLVSSRFPGSKNSGMDGSSARRPREPSDHGNSMYRRALMKGRKRSMNIHDVRSLYSGGDSESLKSDSKSRASRFAAN